MKRFVIYALGQAAIFVATISFFKRLVPDFATQLKNWLASNTGSVENLPIALGYGAICFVPLYLARKNTFTFLCVAGAFLGWFMGRLTGPNMLPAVAFYFSLFSLCLFCRRYYMAVVSLGIMFYGATLIKLFGINFPSVSYATTLALVWNLMHVALVSYPIYKKPRKKNMTSEGSKVSTETYKKAA